MSKKNDDLRPWWRRFLFPKPTLGYAIRLALEAAAAVLFFSFVCRPYLIDGASMKPTYPDRGFMLSNELVYRFRAPRLGEVVIARVDRGSSYLKRVVGVAGDHVRWIGGRLWRNGVEISEPYVVYGCNWNTDEVTVEPGHSYVVGDNRSMPVSAHRHGQVSNRRITGAPLW